MIDPDVLETTDDELEETDKFVWRNWFRQLPLFGRYGAWFTDLDDRLEGANGTLRAAALNYLKPKIKRLEGELSISGGEDAVRLKIPDERNALIREGLLALYDDDNDLLTIILADDYVVPIGDGSAGGQMAVGTLNDPLGSTSAICPRCYLTNCMGHFR